MSSLDQVAAVALGVVAVLIALTAVVIVLLRWASRSGAVKGLVLEDTSPGAQAGSAAPLKPAELVGKRGVAVTLLRPAGTAMFGDQRVDVVTEATFIPRGATIEVTAVEGKRIIVRQVAGTHAGNPSPSH
jgi:membrane-bound serine protease (ClpP class)